MSLFHDMQNRSTWDSYQKYVVEMEPIMRETSERGMPVSPEAHARMSDELEVEMAALEAQMQSLVPDEVKGIKVYKRKPSVVIPFKPSSQAIIRYAKFKKHPIPTDWKTGKATTREKELSRLYQQTKDPLYDCILTYRDRATLANNHLPNWKPGPDGRVHPIFYNTATGQLEARRPNTMNAPNHKASQKGFRGIVIATPGHELLSLDYSGFHALYLAWESGDKNMERLVRMDIHSYMTAHFLKLPHADECLDWPDDQLRDYLGVIKRDHVHTRNAKVKHALLGYNNGMGYYKLFMQYREFFDKRDEAKRLLEMMDTLFPSAAKFRTAMREQAHEQGYLISKFGCIRYFWEVKRWQGGNWSHGDDAEAAVSFIQQNHAHCHLKDVMHQLQRKGWLLAARFITPIHDDLTFECPSQHFGTCAPYIRQVMEAPNPTTGLSVGVECKRGTAWNAMSVFHP